MTMTKIPFTKAHGAHNDFLLTWDSDAPQVDRDEIARAICDRHTGIGADGWMLMRPESGEAHAAIELYNSDGSRSAISGNGTRCVAALLVSQGVADSEVRIRTGAGVKTLRLIEGAAGRYEFEMTMGKLIYNEANLRRSLAVGSDCYDVTILDVGNPQCAAFVNDFSFDWRGAGAAIEKDTQFPDRTNVSFIRVVDRHSIDVLFWERGAGETMSSGTGSTGAAFATVARGLVDSPVLVITPAGNLEFRLVGDIGYLMGPAELIGGGEFYLRR